jgi:Asp-tRNA(Asn)/Glu-tRNA(Gln) amidotransferase B subunit
MPLSVPIGYKKRAEIMIKVIKQVGKRFKKRTPSKNINSFNYFKRAILDEFEIYEDEIKGGEIKIGSTRRKEEPKEEYNLEELYSNK